MRLLKDLFHATGREKRLARRVGHRPGRHRQEPPGVGVPEVHRRPRSRRSTGTAAARRPTARASPSGRWARWSASAAGCARATTRPRPARTVTATVAEWVTDADERRLDRAALLTLLGCRVAAWRPTSCSAPGARSSSASPSTAPVVLVFEDMHFADTGLLDFIDHLLEWSRGAADLRRHPGPTGPASSAARTGAPASATSSRCTSSRCPRRTCASCSPASCPGCPDAAAASIVARADGIPLYAVETVRTLVAEGRLVERGRRLRARRRPHARWPCRRR